MTSKSHISSSTDGYVVLCEACPPYEGSHMPRIVGAQLASREFARMVEILHNAQEHGGPPLEYHHVQ